MEIINRSYSVNSLLIEAAFIGKFFFEEGPDVIVQLTDGIAYMQNGRIHREDGPAIIYNAGHKSWYYEGKKIAPMDLFEKLTPEQKEKVIWELDEWK